MTRLATALLLSSLAIWACSGDSGGNLFTGPGNSKSGGRGTILGGGANSSVGGGGPSVGGFLPGTGGSAVVVSGGSTGVVYGGSPGISGGTASGNTGGSGPGPSYYTNGVFHGYAWTASSGTGTTITPANYTDKSPAGAPFCASGSVGAMTDFSGTAMVGININQEIGTTEGVAWTPTGTGIVINVTNRGTSTLRVQIQGPNGANDPTQRWCAPLSESGKNVELPWAAFNSKCWDGTGDYYNGQPITAVIVLVPGSDKTATPFDFCVNSVGVIGGSSGTGGTGSGTGGRPSTTGGSGNCTGPGTPTGTLTGQYDAYQVIRCNQRYVVQNNVWSGNGSQTVQYAGVSFKVTQQTGSNSTSAGPVSYPSVFVGANNNRNTSTPNLPKQVSALSTVPVMWSYQTNGATGIYNASFDVWFSTSSGGDSGSPSGGYLMVWLYKPSNAQPVGSIAATTTLLGATFDVWYGSNGKPVVSYVYRNSQTSVNFDLNTFIQDARTRNYVQAGWYLTNVFAGFEIWSGGVGLQTTDYSVTVN